MATLDVRIKAFLDIVAADIKAVRGVVSTASTAALTPSSGVANYVVTALAVNLTVNAPSGSPIEGQGLLIRIKDNGTARTIAWNGIFRVIGVTLPTTTVANKVVYIGCKYNAIDTKWDVLAVGQEP